MEWSPQEAMEYYKRLGAPQDQNALRELLLEIQQNSQGTVPSYLIPEIASVLGTKESLIHALIRRTPRLRLGDSHLLEICAGPNCGKHRELAAAAEKLQDERITVRFVPCQRMCGKGPNIRWDGRLHHKADEKLLRDLVGK